MQLIERRSIIQIRSNDSSRKISGTAIVFNKESQLLGGWFTEVILPESVTLELLNSCDILMLWNHNEGDIPLARSKKGKGSLKITLTATGVDFEFEARKTPQGDEVLAAVRAGDVDSCSFAFIVDEEGEDWQSKPEATYLRTIKRFREIKDLSLVNEPAYLETSCRSLDKYKQMNNFSSRHFKSLHAMDSYYQKYLKEIANITSPETDFTSRHFNDIQEMDKYYQEYESSLTNLTIQY